MRGIAGRGAFLLVAIGAVAACHDAPPAAAPAPIAQAAPVAKAASVERAAPRGGAEEGAVIKALHTELARTMDAFKGRADAPYFVGYEVSDRHEVHLSAEQGAMVSAYDVRARLLDVDVRVGSPQLDNTHPLRDRASYEDFFARYGEPYALPLEDDEQALRTQVWSRTERRYRDAVERIGKLRSQQKIKVEEEDRSADFSVEAPSTYIAAPVAIAIDRAAWEPRLRALSAAFREYPEILDSSVTLSATTATRSLVSSEGSAIQMPWTHVRLSISAEAKADDGMELSRFESFDVSVPEHLPTDAAMLAKVREVAADLHALRAAPLAEPWSGPAILEGKAAGVFFHEVFGHRVEGHRQKSEDEGQTFAKKIGQKVMPDFIDVFDDPTLSTLEGTELNGHYFFDDEGVPAQRAGLVDHGVMKTFLMSRSPAAGFVKSNGHGRRSEGRDAVARQANLVVQPSATVPARDLKSKLIAEVVRQHKPYGLRFREIQGGYTNTERSGAQAFKVLPIVVYRVYPDGREELIRGVDLEGTPLTALSKILAAGDDYQVFNGHCGAESGWVPVSASSPSLLVEQIETARKEKSQDKPPVLPAPPHKEAP